MKYLATLGALLASASAHTIFTQLHVNGLGQGHTKGVRVPVRLLPRCGCVATLTSPQTYDGPITDVTSNDMICNGG